MDVISTDDQFVWDTAGQNEFSYVYDIEKKKNRQPEMPTRKPSRTTSKSDKNLPPLPTKPRPGLAVDTSFSRHHGRTPEQVFPNEPRTQDSRFVKLSDITNTRTNATATKEKTIFNEQQGWQLGSKAYVVPATQSTATERTAEQSSQGASALHKRIKGLRPTPLDLSNEISPSDQAITIGLAIPSAAISNHTRSPQSEAQSQQPPPYGQQTERYGYDIATPTIIITPAKDDFEFKSSASPDGSGRRPTSSVYSRYTNSLPRPQAPNQRTPPVPPLPRFAAKSNAALRVATRDSAATKFEEDDSPPLVFQSQAALSICTTFEEQNDDALRSTSIAAQTRSRNSQHVPTPRRSKGWWNVITSPFSAKSGAFSFRSPVREDDGHTDREPILHGASDMACTDRSLDFNDGQSDDNETHSAPATDRAVQDFSSRALIRTPKRSDTAPGAMDLGNAGDVNIYRMPSKGEASLYYDSKRNFPSMIGPKVGGRPRALEDVGDFDPRDSCYQAPRSVGVAIDGGVDTSKEEVGMRESQFYRIPEEGEAAEYYDSNRTFPSLVPHGFEYGNKEMEDWTPRRSVMPDDSISNSRSLTESPSSMDGSDADKAVSSGQARVVEQSPFQSGHAAEFEGFSGAYGPKERGFFTTPSEEEMQGHSPAAPVTAPYLLSPMSEKTPIVEDAHTATYIGAKSANGEAREIDVASTRTPTPSPPALSNGLGNATMATRDAQLAATNPPPAGISEKPPYLVNAQHSRSGSAGLGISDDEAERGLFPPSSAAANNEKAEIASEYPKELPQRQKKSGCRWVCCLLIMILCILVAATVFLCVFFVPFPHVDVPVQAQWLNLTGFPPLPTGISTVIGPHAAKDASGCVSQEQLWTCAVPAREVNMATPDQPDQPNFRFEIRFRNDTVPSNETISISSNSTMYKRSTGQAAQARSLVKRTAWTNLLFSSNPAPPSTEDQKFIGRTTDHNSVPFDGEETPFYISLLEAADLTSNFVPGLQKRDPSFHYPYPTASSAGPSGTASTPTNSSTSTLTSTTVAAGPTNIPQPAMRSDGRPAPAVLYPFAYAQPLRLFNRGQSSEHYGFYTYFDRSMYLSVSSIANSSTFGGSVQANVQLGSANAVCVWSQTRLLFQIWTQKADVTSLSTSQPTNIPLMQSSANDMTAPGSFPYSVTVTLDRHGGEAPQKGVYCYSLNGEQRVTDSVRTWIAENRAFNGELVNPAAVPMNNGTTLTKRSDSTGIDGGSGGCACQWQNWE